MSEDQRLEQKINECQEQFERLSAVIKRLNEQYILENRAEEKLRIEALLKEREQERQAVEQQLGSLEAKQKQQQLPRLEQEARRLERNKAFKEALETWQEICRLKPDDPQIAGEIHRLEGRLQQSQRLTDSIRQLTHRLVEIKPIYPTIITRLRQMGETGDIDEDLLSIVDDFLQRRLPAANFMTAWEKLRLDAIIQETENDRRQVEEELLKLEDELTALNAATATSMPHLPRPRASGPIRLFYSYAHEDEALRERLETHLKLLKRQGVLQDWHDRDISAGSEWARQISAQLETADIILLLISPDFIASDYCWDVELQRAMARHEAGEAVVIPVVLRETDWTGAPFGKLQALPRDAKPVTRWADPDAAFVDIARGIRKVIAQLTGKAV